MQTKCIKCKKPTEKQRVKKIRFAVCLKCQKENSNRLSKLYRQKHVLS